MNRCLAGLLAVCALAGCALAGTPERSSAAVLVGVGDQAASTFTDPLFTKLKVKRARYFPPWNVTRYPEHEGWLDQWLDAAETADVEPLVSFGPSPGSKCPKRPCKLPTKREYTKAFKAFRKRWPHVRVISPWNEANHRSQPPFKNPKRAAQYYNIVRKYCRGCTIVAADVIDEPNMERWLKQFRRYAKKPRLWGLHNYRDTNKRRGQKLGGTKRLLEAVKGKVWLTETGGIVRFVLPNNRTLFKKSERRANSATKRMFGLAKQYRKRVKRLYIYHWKAPLYSEPNGRFDAGLVRNDGTARPAYYTVQRHLRSRFFNP
ncbi:MAG TPA: hypothetical protein VFQ12_02000 [Thermoleophilaceae bacterium]|nr:hypothetical protein [Thermoleophilaceae bacterium]